MDKRILIGGIVIVILIIIIIVLLMKKEKYTSSGTASNNPQNLLAVDGNGNITTTTSVDVTSANVQGSLSVNGYTGNPGDVLVSNGSGSPAWVPGFPKFIGYFPYELPASHLYPPGSTIFSTNLSGLNPGKNLLIQIFMPVRGDIAGTWNYAFNATINNLSKPSQTLVICFVLSNNYYISPGMNPTLTFYFPSDFNGTSEQSLAITTGSRNIISGTNTDEAPMSGWCTVYEIQ